MTDRLISKNYYRIVYVVLVYKNIKVTESFFQSLSKFSDYQVIVVNSYFDDKTELECMQLAKKHSAIFISVKNNGYGAGNNVGIKYALDHFNFKYLIVSNSDIEVQNLQYLYDKDCKSCIISPNTIMPNGKKQNPCSPFKSKFVLWFIKKGYELNNYRITRIGHILNRVGILLFHFFIFFFRKEKYKIFMGHGSFIIFGRNALETLFPVFNEKMFLYNEELYLGLRAKQLNIPIYFIPSLRVLHMEGASAGYVYSKQFPLYRESYFSMVNSGLNSSAI